MKALEGQLVSEFPIENFSRFSFQSGRDHLAALEFGPADGPDLVLVHGIRDQVYCLILNAHVSEP